MSMMPVYAEEAVSGKRRGTCGSATSPKAAPTTRRAQERDGTDCQHLSRGVVKGVHSRVMICWWGTSCRCVRPPPWSPPLLTPQVVDELAVVAARRLVRHGCSSAPLALPPPPVLLTLTDQHPWKPSNHQGLHVSDTNHEQESSHRGGLFPIQSDNW